MSVDWNSRQEQSQKPRTRTFFIGLIVVIIAVVAGIAYAALGPQTTQPIPIPPKPVVNTNCSTLSTSSSGSSITPNQGVAMLNCGTSNAITTTGTAGGGVSATPTFTLPTLTGGGSLTLNIVQASSCLSTSLTPLTSGTAFDFAQASSYNYCLSYTGVNDAGDTISTFTISWV